MYRIIKDGANIGLTENLNYIKQAENGCYVLCPEHDASGIVFAGTVYHLLGREILICAGAVTVLVTAFTFIMVWRTNDLSPLAYLIPAVFTELGVGTGFYYSKAKAENRIKLRKMYGPEIYNDTKEM